MSTSTRKKKQRPRLQEANLGGAPDAAELDQPAGTSLKWLFAIALGLVALDLVVYSQITTHDFIPAWDDGVYVTKNGPVLGGLTWSGVNWAFTTGYASNWHPITWLSHMLDVQLFGLDAGRHHLVNLLLHISNTLLLFGLLNRMTGAVGRSAFVAAAFGVHPLHVESVAWVAERKDVLSTFFWWLMILAYVAYVRRPTWEKYGLMLLALALGLMSKPMLVTAPLLLLLLDIWPLSRGSLAHINGWFRLVLEKIPLVGLIVASSIVTLIAQRGGGAVVNVQQLPLEGRISNALLSYVSYLWKAVWPTHLAAFYPFPHDIPFSWVAASAVTLLGLSAVAWRLSRSYPFAFVGWFWFVLTLIPVIGLVQVGSQAMADRYTYVPLVGIFIIVAWGVPAVSTRWSVPMNAVRVSALIVIGALTAAGYVQAGYWRDSTSLWQHAVDVSSGDSFVAHAALGAILEAEGKPEEAMGHYYNAVRSNPDFPDGHLSLGAKLVDRGRVDEAMAEFSEALRLRPDYPEAHLSLGMALASKGRTDEAIAQYTEAIRLQPALAIPHFQLGAALATQSRTDGAIAEYREALRLNPDLVDAYVGLGSVFFNEHRWNEAVREWSEAIRLRPDVSNLWLNRGNALATEGRMPEAIRDFSEAVRLSPDSENAHFSLARAFAATGRVPEAIAEFRSVLRLNPRNADAQRSLAALGGRGRD